MADQQKCLLKHRQIGSNWSARLNAASPTMHKKTSNYFPVFFCALASPAKLTNIENAISVTKDRVISESILESGETAKDGLSPLSREDFNLVTKSKKIQPKEVSDDNFKLLLKN